MKKLVLFFVLATWLLVCSNAFAVVNQYGCTGLTGGTAGTLDSLDITGATDPNVDNLAENDVAEVITISGETVTIYNYVFDASGTDAESSPTVIRPDDYSTAGVWRLALFHVSMIPDLSSIYSESKSTVLAEPDQLQPISDAWLIAYFPAETYPSGVTIDAIHITSSATCTDVLNFEEWAQDATSSSSTVEEITLSGTFTEDDGTLTDAAVAADGRLMVDLPATPTDIGFLEITVIYHAN